MRVTPKSEAEVSQARLLPAGTYDFEVVSAEDAISKSSGAEMIKVGLRIYDADGNAGGGLLFDYLMDKVPYKIRHAAAACGLLADYENGHLDPSDMVNKTGKVKLRVRNDEQYGDQNTVGDYVVPESTGATSRNASTSRPKQPAMAGGGYIDDEIPFGPEWR